MTTEKAILPLQAAFVREFAQEWVQAWNSHEIDQILAHYADDVVLTSPVALKLMGGDGSVGGKLALKDYFLRGLNAYPNLHFDLLGTLWGLETIVLYYRNTVRGDKTAEVMRMNACGKVQQVWANYDQ